MAGVTRPVTLRVTAFKCGPHPFTKKPMCGADVEGTIKRTDCRLKVGVPAISDDVKLEINVEFYPSKFGRAHAKRVCSNPPQDAARNR